MICFCYAQDIGAAILVVFQYYRRVKVKVWKVLIKAVSPARVVGG